MRTACKALPPKQMNRSKNGKTKQGRNKDTEHLTHIGCKQELNSFPDIVVNTSPFLDRSDYSSKIIIRQNHIRNVLCNVRTRNTHTNADVSALDGGSVIIFVTAI